uniref:Putative lysozyme n=2 Tax=Anopheles triannulatus TaxID=58253 RepID=A0A2M3ZY71_9DIPT
MKNVNALALLLFVTFLGVSLGKVYRKCELARIMQNNGFPREQLRDWMCLVQKESGFNTSAINHNRGGTTDYGLFQINNRYWCDSSYGANDCKITCKSLLDDDIVNDLQCVKRIYKRHKFTAWVAWNNKCQGKVLPTVNECF